MTDRNDKKNILLVDDVSENLAVLNGILKNFYNIRFAKNGMMALKLVEARHPDLILLDIMMPVMDGIEVCKRLKSNPLTENIPIIFVTAKSSEVDIIKGVSHGADDYITKPVDAQIILSKVEFYLNKYS